MREPGGGEEAGVGVASADSASKREHGFLSTEFCFTSTHPWEAAISLARQEARRMSTAA